MTDPLDLLDEASWLYEPDDAGDDWSVIGVVVDGGFQPLP